MKDELLSALRFIQRTEQDFIETRPVDQRATGTLEHWSAKDLLAHIGTWKNRNIDNLEALDSGETVADPADIDDVNTKIFANCASLSWSDVVALVQHGNERVRAYLEKTAEKQLWSALPQDYANGGLLWRVIAGDNCIHPVTHISLFYLQNCETEIAERVQKKSVEVLSRIDDMPNWQGTILYNQACFYSIAGQINEAIEGLKQALILAPSLTEWSQEDPDFAPIRNDPSFQALFSQKAD